MASLGPSSASLMRSHTSRFKPQSSEGSVSEVACSVREERNGNCSIEGKQKTIKVGNIMLKNRGGCSK